MVIAIGLGMDEDGAVDAFGGHVGEVVVKRGT